MVDASDIEAIVAQWTGIAVEKMGGDEMAKLARLVRALALSLVHGVKGMFQYGWGCSRRLSWCAIGSGLGLGDILLSFGGVWRLGWVLLYTPRTPPSPRHPPTQSSVLKEKIVGQDAAVEVVASALVRSRCGLKDPNRPVASLLCVGPTGAWRPLGV